ncbi:hypothetical protein NV377_14325 [Paenibacillus sp. T3-5-0-4]|nr:hypothetical protein [Paenibacillus endoradicis]
MLQNIHLSAQEDDTQRKRVAQRTLLVREQTKAFDGGHIRRRLAYSELHRDHK